MNTLVLSDISTGSSGSFNFPARTTSVFGTAERVKHFTRRCVLLAGLGVWLFPGIAEAAPNIQISSQPITWNIIGLDSNNVDEGPNQFPLGVRVCNTGDAPAANIMACVALTGGTGAAYISIKDDPCVTSASLAPGDSADFFFTVEVERTTDAYSKTRDYEITVSADGLSAQVTTGQLFVEQLVSQNRNAVLSLVGPPTVTPGECRQFVLEAETAPNGYEQLTTFVNFPNQYFRIESITAFYTNDGNAADVDNDKVYADACGWDPVAHDCGLSLPPPGSGECAHTFLPSTFPGGKAGGDITVIYEVCVLKAFEEPVHLSTLINDKSGSSYHYNTDFGKDILIVDTQGTDLCVVKSDSQDPVEVGEEYDYFVTVLNLGETTATDVVVTDTLPLGVTYLSANPPPDSGPNPLRWEFDEIGIGGSIGISIRVRAECDGIGTVINTAEVSTITSETSLLNNLTTESTLIIDTEGPVIDCEDVETSASGCDTSVTLHLPLPDLGDNCGATSVTLGFPVRSDGLELQDPFPVGITEVTWTATDDAGNETSCTTTVTVHPGECPDCVIVCPPDITVFSDDDRCGTDVDYLAETSGNCGPTSLTCTPPPGSFFEVGETLVTCTIKDAAGSDVVCTFTVTVIDNVPPEITCPDDIITSASGCETSVTLHPPLPAFEDNCTTVTLDFPERSDGLGLQDPYPVGVTIITWTVTDAAGNQASCTQTITVLPGDCPDCMLHCPVEIRTFTDPELCGASVDYQVVPSGNCGPTTLTCTPPPGSFFPVGETLVTCTIENASGEDVVCTFTVTVIDNVPPEITCPDDLTVTADGCETSVTLHPPLPEVDENCTTFTLDFPVRSDGLELQDPYPIGVTTITWTVTDEAGNESSCTQTITVLPGDCPDCVLICPPNIEVSTEPDLCGATVDYVVEPGGNCGETTLVCTPPPGSFFPVGVTVVTCTMTDDSGSQVSCTFTVTVFDDAPPLIDCPENISIGTDPGVCGATVDYETTATDNCTTVDLICTPPPGSLFPVGETLVTCVATDTAGNDATCTFTVTVLDDEPPSLICTGDIVVNANPQLCSAVVDYQTTVTDNCSDIESLVCVPPPGSTFPIGITTVTCIATDTAGNQATCTFTVTVLDSQPPVIDCPPDLIINNEQGECSMVVDYETTATDNCTTEVLLVCTPPPGSIFEAGITTVTCTATDDSGNMTTCTFLVNVRDRQPPVIICPPNITVNADEGLCSAVVDYQTTASDNCTSDVQLICTPPPGTAFPVGMTPVVCIARDRAGNTVSCSFTVTVRDRQAPILECPESVIVAAQDRCCEAVVDYQTTVTDNCAGPVTVVCMPPPGSLFPRGTTIVTCMATDAAGNTATCSFPVTVVDEEAPLIFCPIDFSVSADPGCCEALVDYVSSATDNCELVDLVCDPPPGSFFPLGFTDVICTATDAVGNVTTCSFIIEVCDHEAPVIVCAADIFVVAEECATEASVNVTPPTATDNCTSFPLITRGIRSDNRGLNDPYPLGVTTITWAAIDGSNNTATCTTRVSVAQTGCSGCTFVCPQNIFVSTDPGEPDAVVTYPAPTFVGNCDGATVTFDPPSGSSFEPGLWTVTALAQLPNGRTQECSFTVSVTDTEPPQITCPADVTVTAPDCQSTAEVVLNIPFAVDNTGLQPDMPIGVRSDGLDLTDPFPLGTTIVTWTATDLAGNSTSCSADVTVNAGPCEVLTGCTRQMPYWRDNPDAWPVESLTLGNRTYTKAELLSILNTPDGGNRLVRLAYQLIAAKLNVAAGADPSQISGAIAQADALIGSQVVPPVGTGTLRPKLVAPIHLQLGSYNIGTVGPGPCLAPE